MMRRPDIRRTACGVVLAALLVVAGASAAAAQDPTVAPATSVSNGGRTVTVVGTNRSFTVSQSQGLAPGGQAITVTGAGFDPAKGIYVALCVIPPTDQPPSPCGGGQDLTGSSGASRWISSDPPDYSGNLAVPYGPGGSFSVSISVGSVINPTLDCAMVRCAVVTRNDHTRGSDRSQDLFLPVTFAAGGGQPNPTTPTTAPPVVTTTTVTTTTLPPAPSTTLAADRRSVSNGAQRLSVDRVQGLDPTGATVTVAGEGFDPAAGVYVALCRVPAAGQPPGPCTTGDGLAAWLSSEPPDYGVGVAEPFGDGGSFAVELELPAVIDGSTDCREVACAIATRRDDVAPADRTLDLLVPVAFAASAPTTTEPDDDAGDGDGEDDEVAAAAAGGGGADGASSAVPLALGVVAALGVAGATAYAVRRRRGSTPA